MSNKWITLDDKERLLIRNALKTNTNEDDHKILVKIEKKLVTADKRIATSSAKGKGRELQHWACRKISGLIGIEFDNQSDDSLIRSREMGQSGVDVILRGEAKKKFPFAIECKNTETINFRSFVEQAQKYSKEGKWLLVVRTKSLPETTVTMSWETFEKLFKGDVE